MHEDLAATSSLAQGNCSWPEQNFYATHLAMSLQGCQQSRLTIGNDERASRCSQVEHLAELKWICLALDLHTHLFTSAIYPTHATPLRHPAQQ